MKLTGKLIISGKITAETGLHIGGSKSSLDIGGVDLNVIKTPQGVPFIPGSSLKGKLRSLLAKTEGSIAASRTGIDKDHRRKNLQQLEQLGILIDEHFPYLIQIFGSSGDNDDRGEVTRLLVRDANLDTGHFSSSFDENEIEMDFKYSDVKWENTIDRKRGTALNPRQLERVPAGASFDFEIVYDLYENVETTDYQDANGQPEANGNGNISILKKHLWALETAMNLLQDDYLGGQGSRGYGKVSFQSSKVTQKKITPNGKYESVELTGDIKTFADNLKQL